MPKKEMHGGLEEISLSFYDARSMTSSQIMISTPIVIATAAARFSSAQAALGQSDSSATSSYGDLLAAQRNVTGIAYAGINSEEN